ncbi:MAG TPA: phycobilisome protein [Trichocoleus sp.]
MKTLLLESIRQADGRYLSDAELKPLETYVRSFAVRFNTYNLLQEKSDTLILQTLRKLVQTHRRTVQEHSSKCQRDMAYTLACISQAILLDDEPGFIEGYVIWMQNITRALHKEDSAVQAYRLLQAEVAAMLPAESAQLINHHLDSLIKAFSESA